MGNRQLHKLQDWNQNLFSKCEFWHLEDFISKLSIIYYYKKKIFYMFQENILDLKIKFMSLITKLDSQVTKQQYLQI